MNEHVGTMWSAWDQTDLFCITTNGSLTRAGHAVLGRGIAKQAAVRFPKLPDALGRHLQAHPDWWKAEANAYDYGLLVSDRWPAAKLAFFQVKYQWMEDADLTLITHSLLDLALWCSAHEDRRVDLNWPGIGNGRLAPGLVIPTVRGILGVFPNVHLWSQSAHGLQ